MPQWTAPPLVQPATGGHETVLVVEDDEAVRAAVTDMLGELGYAVLRAENAEQALSLLGEGRHVDVLFSDVVMPGTINARELATLAREKLPNLKVLFTSGYTQNAIVHNGRLDAGVELLGKPYRKDDLARKLRMMLDSRAEQVASSAKNPAAAKQESPPVTPDVRVLVVEDSALIRLTTIDMVTELGFAFAEAADAASALEILKGDEDIQILLTDLGLPGMSGADLVAEARKLKPELMVVAVSGYSEEIGRKNIQGAKYLQKPFTLEQLREVLKA